MEKDKKMEAFKVLEAKKALLHKWECALNELEIAILEGKETDRFFDDIQEAEDGCEIGYIRGCIDEDDKGISVFPNFRGQITLRRYNDGSWG